MEGRVIVRRGKPLSSFNTGSHNCCRTTSCRRLIILPLITDTLTPSTTTRFCCKMILSSRVCRRRWTYNTLQRYLKSARIHQSNHTLCKSFIVTGHNYQLREVVGHVQNSVTSVVRNPHCFKQLRAIEVPPRGTNSFSPSSRSRNTAGLMSGSVMLCSVFSCVSVVKQVDAV